MNKAYIKKLLNDKFPEKQPLSKEEFKKELKKMAKSGLIKFEPEQANHHHCCYGCH